MTSDEASKYRRLAAVPNVFTPGAPVDRLSLFAGRHEKIIDVVNAVGQRGQHAVLYGERGVGKTSLANVLAEIFVARELPYLHSVGVNCATLDNFRTLWTNVFSELGILDAVEAQTVEITPETVRRALEDLPQTTLIVIDEIDRLEDENSLSLLADSVKTLSDHSVGVTLVLVGVADSVEHLIGDHRSVERPLTQVHMPRMGRDELVEIVDKGLEKLSMAADPQAKRRIARLSEGLPHYTHLLSLYATQRAIQDDRDYVQQSDVTAAIYMSVEKVQHTIRASYQKAIRSAYKNALYEQVLLACALAQKDELGCFVSGAVREPMSRIMNRRYEIPAFAKHLKEFTEPLRGEVLQKIGEERKWVYRFDNPLLQPYVILRGISKGLLTEEAAAEFHTGDAASIPDSPDELV